MATVDLPPPTPPTQKASFVRVSSLESPFIERNEGGTNNSHGVGTGEQMEVGWKNNQQPLPNNKTRKAITHHKMCGSPGR